MNENKREGERKESYDVASTDGAIRNSEPSPPHAAKCYRILNLAAVRAVRAVQSNASSWTDRREWSTVDRRCVAVSRRGESHPDPRPGRNRSTGRRVNDGTPPMFPWRVSVTPEASPSLIIHPPPSPCVFCAM